MEKDLSFELIAEDPLEDVELELLIVLEVAVQVKEETDEVVELEGDGGEGEILFERGMILMGAVRACEITSLSWTTR